MILAPQLGRGRIMRWLVERLFRDDFLELEDGVAVHYPNGVTGPGFILRGGDRNKLLGYHTSAAWMIPAYFAFPGAFLIGALMRLIWEARFMAPLGEALLIASFFLLICLFERKAGRFLESLDRRPPAFWDSDLTGLRAAGEARAQKPRIYLPLLGVIFAAALLALVLDVLLLVLTT